MAPLATRNLQLQILLIAQGFESLSLRQSFRINSLQAFRMPFWAVASGCFSVHFPPFSRGRARRGFPL